jgi:hypothetical protein
MLIPFLIYVVVPIVGLLAFWALLGAMRHRGISSPPVNAFFILFFTIGGWLEVLLTVWLWEWSGMASLGMLYLLLIAPVLTGVMCWRLRTQRGLSGFHRCAFFLNGSYPCLAIIVIGVWSTYLGKGK